MKVLANKIISKFKNCSFLDKFDYDTVRFNLDYEQIHEYDYDLLFDLEFISWQNKFYKDFYS